MKCGKPVALFIKRNRIIPERKRKRERESESRSAQKRDGPPISGSTSFSLPLRICPLL
jgi:hypothetical protein